MEGLNGGGSVGPMNVLDHAFIQHALVAGVPIAAAAGLAGYLLVVRSQIFSGDALSHVAFTGALGALAFGIDPIIGLLVATVLVGSLLSLLGERGRVGDVAIGVTFAWILGLGVLALSVFSSGLHASTNGAAGARVLFGSIFGLDLPHAALDGAIASVIVLVLIFLGRPLLFASIDPAVAAARGLPVSAIGMLFMAAVGATAGVATQAVGALLILGLLAAPAGAAQRLTASPYGGMALSVAIAVVSMTLGIVASDIFARVPPSFSILAFAVASYLIAFAATSRPAGRARLHLGAKPLSDQCPKEPDLPCHQALMLDQRGRP
jgi:zinc/manganese transport system permease protein